MFYLLMALLITLAIVFPFELGEKADPLQTPPGIKPEWYFLSMYHVLKYFPKTVGIFVIGLAPLLLLFWAFLDTSKQRNPMKRPISITFCILVLISLLVFGVMGAYSESKVTFFGKTYDVDIYGIPHLVASNVIDHGNYVVPAD